MGAEASHSDEIDGTLSKRDRIKLAVDVWKQSIDVQRHFNDICLKIRNFFIMVVKKTFKISLCKCLKLTLNSPWLKEILELIPHK